jgi:HlyD family secretion protein
MSTRRGDDWQCDHGAQYFTARDPDFRAEVALDPAERARLGAAQVLPGMPVEVMLATGSRSALSYLMKPVTDYFARAFRET